MNYKIIVFNAGSATLKFGVYDFKKPSRELVRGNFERYNLSNSFLRIRNNEWNFKKPVRLDQALKIIIEKLELNKKEIKVIGHRVVHGGDKYYQPTVVTKKVWHQISKFNELAPLHNPVNLKVINACFKIFPNTKNVAVFDTAFFRTLKPEYYHYAIPYQYYEKYHIRRYGFHGISHEVVAKEAALKLKKKYNKLNLITVHLGSGCSITAIEKGRAIKTSFGFTPLEGLVMGTRTGDLDATIPLFLQKKLKKSPEQVEEIITKKSGLLGLSGFSSDMREIIKAAGKPVIDYHGPKKFTKNQRRRAKLAFDVFMTNLRHFVVLYTGFLGKVDAVVFTGGIGERSPVVRKLAVAGLNFLKRPKIIVVKTNEEKFIAESVKNKV